MNARPRLARAPNHRRWIVSCAAALLVGTALGQTPLTFTRPVSRPNSIFNLCVSYDEVRQEGVLFGGAGWSADISSFDETWTWDGRRWRERLPATRLAPRQFAAMAWDPNTQCVLMFGGLRTGNGPIFGDTWLWNGTDWQTRASSGPSPRYKMRMGTDRLRNRVVLFGGLTANGPSNETWEWDGVQWSLRTPLTHTPFARYLQVMAWNPTTRRVAMFGGNAPPFTFFNFLPAEEWDGQDWMSNPGIVVGGPQPGYVSGTAVPDPAGRGVLIYGNRVVNFSTNPVTSVPVQYLWDGKTLRDEPSATPMPIRSLHESVFLDRSRGEVIAYSGAGLAGPGERDTWKLELSSRVWKPADESLGPSVGSWATILAHVPWLDAFLVFDGGRDAWWWRTDAGYTFACPSPVNPGNPSNQVTLAWILADPVRHRIYGYYYQLGYLFELTGTGWQFVPQAQHGLPASATFAGFDPRDAKFVFLASSGLGQPLEVRKWDGATVTTEAVVPTGTSLFKPTVDTDRGVVSIVALDGYNGQAGSGTPVLREWDGNTWTAHSCPDAGFYVIYSFMPGLGCVLGTSPAAGLWAWDGVQWTQLQPLRQLPTLVNSGGYRQLCYDASRHRMRLSLLQETVMFEDLWDLHLADLQTNTPEPTPGTTVQCNVQSPSHAGQPWLLAMSTATYPGIPLVGLQPEPYRVLPLANDDLFVASLGSGLRGFLDAQGTATASITFPNLPSLVGFRCYAAAITLAPGAQLGLVSAPVEFYVRR